MCDDRERLIEYLYDEGDAAARRSFERHLAACEACRQEVRALRTVRTDLLAWDVPAHESVWTPFAPAPAVPWFRQVPAWAMAAAATLVFAIGGAGGFVTRAVLAASDPPAPQVLTAADLASLRQQILEQVRADVTGQVGAVSARVSDLAARPTVNPAVIVKRAESLVADSDQRQQQDYLQRINGVTMEFDRQRRLDQNEMRRLINSVQTTTHNEIVSESAYWRAAQSKLQNPADKQQKER